MQSPLERLLRYFQNMADTLETKRQAAGIFDNRGDSGGVREDILLEFLANHLPARCRIIKGGFIFDASNTQSQQIDLIVINDLTLQFQPLDSGGRSGKSFNCIEGSYCAISVKTFLDKDQLADAIGNLASIPPMPDMTAQISPIVENREEYNYLPACIIFAYDGLALETLYQHFRDYTTAHPEIPFNRLPDIIIVNNKYMIIKTGFEGATLRNGEIAPPRSFIPQTAPNIGAYSLLRLLEMIQKIASIGSHVSLSFTRYIDGMDF